MSVFMKVCPYCSAQFALTSTLQRHVQAEHDYVPAAIYNADAGHTELVLRDVAIVWVEGVAFDLGYSFEGELIAVRVPGDRTKR